MLVLSRKLDDEIWIGSNIFIKIVNINNGIVKIGIDAPKDVEILRGELKKELEKINKQSAQNKNSENIEELRSLFSKWEWNLTQK